MIDLRKIFGRNLRGKLMYALRWVPDKPYLQIFFFACNWKFIHFRHPRTFCDKMNWMKIYDRHPEYSRFADKLAVREYIKREFGEQYVFPIYGAWKSFDEIDFNSLPEKFVLKCNFDSGSVKVVENKNNLSENRMQELRTFYNRRMKMDFFYAGREYPYKGIPKFIFAEKYMESSDSTTESFHDYKFMCFGGVPKIMYIETERSVGVRMNFFDLDFNPITDIIGDKPAADHEFVKPDCFDEMVTMATKMSQGMKFVRIDFRVVDGRVYFGEYTFYDNGGFRGFKPEYWDTKMANWIELD